MRGEQAYRLAPVGARGDRVGGQVLAEHVVEEDLGAGAGQPVDEPGRRVEEHHDRVEVPVGGLGPPLPGVPGLAARLGRAPGCSAPDQRSASPLARHTAQSTSSAVAPGAAAASRAVASSPATVCAGRRPAPVDVGQLGRVAQRLDEQLPGGPAVTGGQGERPQPLPQPALGERVGPAERRVQQRDRGLLVQRGPVRGRSAAGAAAGRPPVAGAAAGPRRA